MELCSVHFEELQKYAASANMRMFDGITAHAYHNVQIERTASGDKLQDEFFSLLKPGLSSYTTDADAGILYQLNDTILQRISSKF